MIDYLIFFSFNTIKALQDKLCKSFKMFISFSVSTTISMKIRLVCSFLLFLLRKNCEITQKTCCKSTLASILFHYWQVYIYVIIRFCIKGSLYFVGYGGAFKSICQYVVEFISTLDLMFVVGLTTATSNVSIRPLAETGHDLLDTNAWVIAIVTIYKIYY